MQVIAFQDPTTGQFFGSQALLDEHLTEQAGIAKAKQAALDATNRMIELRYHVAHNLATPGDLVRLTTEMYTEYLPLMNSLAPLGRGKNPKRPKPVTLLSVTAHDFAITPATSSAAAEFAFNINVSLSSEPRYECNPLGGGITPYELMGGFSSNCGGCRSHDDGHYSMGYYMRAPISELPKMEARLKELKVLYTAKEAHDDAVRSASAAAVGADPEIARLREELNEARAALANALARRDQCGATLDEREGLVAAKAAAQHTFVQSDRWAELLDGFGDSLELYASEDAPTALRHL